MQDSVAPGIATVEMAGGVSSSEEEILLQVQGLVSDSLAVVSLSLCLARSLGSVCPFLSVVSCGRVVQWTPLSERRR